MIPAMSTSNLSGFECVFTEQPPKVLQTDCLICLHVLRNPYQVVCCGKSYCKSCIDRIIDEKKPCPHCHAENFTLYPNKGLEQSLKQLHVHCVNKEEGCEWSGELGELDKHLNLEPPAERQLEGCEFSKVKCRHCINEYQRQNIEQHQVEQCQYRPFSCKFCHQYKSTFDDVVNNHLKECGHFPVQCTNGCGESTHRENLKSHIARDCPLTVIDCDFLHAGCEIRLARKDMSGHLTSSMVDHMLLMSKKLALLQRENELLKLQVAELQSTQNTDHVLITSMYPHLNESKPLEITMPNFKQQRKDKRQWYSQPFYTHLCGYKLCLMVSANGYFVAEGTHVSMCFYIMRGEFDDSLEWPCCGEITFQLLCKPQSGRENLKKTVKLEGDRVTKGEKATWGQGVVNLLPHEDIDKYVQDDCLYFQVLNLTQGKNGNLGSVSAV